MTGISVYTIGPDGSSLPGPGCAPARLPNILAWQMPRGLVAAVLIALLTAPGTAPGVSSLATLLPSLAGEGQGLFVEAEDGTVLAAQAASHPVHPASVTKVATTLALLEHFGPEHRFETRLLVRGEPTDGVVTGDLIVEGGGDPFFVSEHAGAIARRLRATGIRTVAGSLLVRGPFVFNWKPDPTGDRLRAVLTGQIPEDPWTDTAGPRVAAVPPEVALRVVGTPGAPDAPEPPERLLATHRSPPLLLILKALNGYSNNVFRFLSTGVGGPAAVEALARAVLPAEMRDEVRIDDAAGGGTTNRLSPRAAVAVLRALEYALRARDLDLPDVLPVSGVDPGTLRERFAGPGERGTVVGKTGTYGEVGASGLVGAVRTRRYGRVRFAVLNAGVPVAEARARQDAVVRALVAHAGGAPPWPRPRPAADPVSAASLR